MGTNTICHGGHKNHKMVAMAARTRHKLPGCSKPNILPSDDVSEQMLLAYPKVMPPGAPSTLVLKKQWVSESTSMDTMVHIGTVGITVLGGNDLQHFQEVGSTFMILYFVKQTPNHKIL